MVGGIPAERARIRSTLAYQATPRVRVGLELNPLEEDLGPIANVLLVEETGRRPAIVVGTSSARIGSDSGRAVYATASKDLEPWLDLPLAAYAGASYDGFDHRFREIGGATVRWAERLETTHSWDGVNLHHLVGWDLGGGRSLGLLVVEQDGDYFYGASFGTWFSFEDDAPAHAPH